MELYKHTIGRFTENKEIKKEILVFSTPIIVEQMLMSLITLVNSAMVGHIDALSMSAVGLTSQPVFIATAVFQSFNVGATALISRAVGAKENSIIKKIVYHTLLTSFLLGIILAILGYIYSEQIVIFMGANSQNLAPATLYMKYMSVGILLQSIPLAVSSILRGAGYSRPPLVYNTTANVVNVILGFCLINGFLFFPRLGLLGAAIAATMAKLVACLMSVIILLRSEPPFNISLKDKFKFDLNIYKRIMDISLSAAGEQFIMRVGFLVYTKTIAELGTIPLAAHIVVNNITGLVSNVISGFSVAASSYTGRLLGQKRSEDIDTYVNEIRFMGFVFSVAIGQLFLFAGRPIASVFTNDIDVVILSSQVLFIGALLTFPQNTQLCFSGSLRGAGDTKWMMIVSLISISICRIGLAILLVKKFHLGLMGAWSAALLDQTIRALLVYLRYKSGKWKKISI